MEKGKTNGFIFIIGILIIGIWYYREQLFEIAQPFGWGIVIAFLLMPIADRMEKMNIPSAVSTGIIYGVFGLLFLLSLWFGVPLLKNGIESLVESLPKIWEQTKEFMKNMAIDENILNPILEKVLSSAQNINVMEIASSWSGGITNFSVGLVLSGYFLKDRRKLGEETFELLPERFQKEAKVTFHEITVMFGSFVRGRFLLSLCVGILTYIMLWAFGIPYRFLFAVLAAVLDILPIFGPVIAGIPIALFAFTQSIGKGIGTIIGIMAVQQIENLFLHPKIMGNSVGLHPVTTILAVLVGASFFGFFGMILSVPVFAAGKILIKRIFSHIV